MILGTHAAFHCQKTKYDSHLRAAGLPGADHRNELRLCLGPCRASTPWSLLEPAGSRLLCGEAPAPGKSQAGDKPGAARFESAETDVHDHAHNMFPRAPPAAR